MSFAAYQMHPRPRQSPRPHNHPPRTRHPRLPPRSGWLSSAIMGLFALRLGSWLLPSLLGRLAFEVELYGGLVVFAGYIIFDSQVGFRSSVLDRQTGSKRSVLDSQAGPEGVLGKGQCPPGAWAHSVPSRRRRSATPPPDAHPLPPLPQVIVERCGAGDFDFIKHSVDLFLDFVAVFARVLIILLRSSEKREEEERRRRNRRRD